MANKTNSAQTSSNTRMTHAERTDLSDTKMFEAAVSLIVERGLDKTTLKDVGELAGYSRSLAGYRFGTKGNLFNFVIKRVGEEWSKELLSVTEGKTGYPAIAQSIDTHYDFLVNAPLTRRAFYLLWFDATDISSEVRESMIKIHQRRQSDVEQWINDDIANGNISGDVNAEAVAKLFLASSIGILYHWLLEPEALGTVKQLHEDLKLSVHKLLFNSAA
ncbi:TetR/AcrR family transcriptional regulator [Leucothrix sargassi]|nr:TetR/AcrR family transcriptional regulator [Leucothrix sargassi]